MPEDFWFFVSNIGFTIDFIGKILISYTAIMVHHRVWQEHKIDERVFAEMATERKIGFIGITMMLTGFLLELIARIYITSIF